MSFAGNTRTDSSFCSSNNRRVGGGEYKSEREKKAGRRRRRYGAASQSIDLSITGFEVGEHYCLSEGEDPVEDKTSSN
jgi:hypothetical protein